MPVRQEVLNVLLAQLLQERGLIAAPEEILQSVGKRRRHMPDVLVDLQGLRLVIEGDFANRSAAKREVVRQTRERVDEGVAHIGTAVLYPKSLRNITFKVAKEKLATAILQFAVITEMPDTPSFTEGDVDDLADALRRAYGQLVEDRVLEKAVSLIGHGIDGFTKALSSQPATVERFATALGVRDVPRSTKQRAAEE